MKRCSYCGAEYPDDAVVCAFDHTPFESSNPAPVLTPAELEVRFRCLAFAAVFLLALLTSVLIAFLTPKSFRSTAEISVDQNPPDPHPELSGPDEILPPDFFQSEFKIIKSHVVLGKAVDALNLRDVWGKKYNRNTPLSSDRAENILRRNIDLSLLQNTKVIEIQAFDHDPDRAAQLANAVADAYRDYNESRTPKTRWSTILGPAEPELHPFQPNRRLIILLGVMIGIVFGSIAAAVSVCIAACRRKSSTGFWSVLPE